MNHVEPLSAACKTSIASAIVAVLEALLCGSALSQEFAAKAVSPSLFSEPHDMALDASAARLYVSDMGHHSIKVMDAQTLTVIGEFGRGELRAPHDVAFDLDGRLLVADTGNDRLVAYTVEGGKGKLAQTVIAGLSGPEGVAVGTKGELYVTNTAAHTAALYVRGKLVTTVGGRGSNVNFERPHDVEVGPDGRVWIADPGNNRLILFDPQLGFLTAIGGSGYGFREPKYFAVAENGWAYIADQYNDRIQILDSEGRVAAQLNQFDWQNQPERFNHPEGVVVHQNNMWIADTYNNRIIRFER